MEAIALKNVIMSIGIALQLVYNAQKEYVTELATVLRQHMGVNTVHREV